MHLLLHTPAADHHLSRYYKQAFKNAVKLFVVTAFLTEWDDSLELNPKCRGFRVTSEEILASPERLPARK